MEWVMVLMPVGLLILGFPIFIILLATSRSSSCSSWTYR